MKTKPGEWGLYQIAALLGTEGSNFGRFINGVEYPNLAMMQKFEVVFGWPVVEQVQLIPYLWLGRDMRYAMVLKQHMDEWKIDNPRTVSSHDIRMHPDLVPRHATSRQARS